MLVATVTGLWAAVNLVIDTPNAVHVFHCIPPRASNLAYSSVVLEVTLLHSLKKQVTFRADACQTVDASEREVGRKGAEGGQTTSSLERRLAGARLGTLLL